MNDRIKLEQLADLINEYRAAQDAADAAKALILEAMQAAGLRSISAEYVEGMDAAGDPVRKVTTATYTAASADSVVFDTKRFQADQPDLYAAYKTKPRKGASASVRFNRKTA